MIFRVAVSVVKIFEYSTIFKLKALSGIKVNENI